MFWAFVDVAGELCYCPLADFGAQSVCEGKDIYAKAVVAQPLAGDLPLRNAANVCGKIVVMERGACDFVTKVQHAQAAGAVAVIVANTASDDPAAAFVMDAGSRQHDAAALAIPAVMMPYSNAAAVFEQLRRCYLDRRECALTIRFLGAQAAARVLEQTEHAAQQRDASAREQQRQHELETQRLEASKQLRSRLSQQQRAGSIAASQSTVSTPASTPRSVGAAADAASLLASTRTRPSRHVPAPVLVPTSSNVSSGDDETSSAQSSSSSESDDAIESLDSRSGCALSVGMPHCSSVSSSSDVLNHWCPMTTALLVMDVQNYFALRDHRVGSSSGSSNNNSTSIEHYKRIHSVVVPTIEDVLLASRASEGVEVVYSVVESATRDGRDRSRAHKHAGIHIARDGFGAQILARVAPSENDIVIPRTGINIFESTNLDYTLRNLGVSHLVVLGISTLSSLRVCIQSALEKGYQVTVLREGVALDAAAASASGSALAQRQCLDAWLDGVEAIGCQVQRASAFVRELQAFSEPDAFLETS